MATLEATRAEIIDDWAVAKDYLDALKRAKEADQKLDIAYILKRFRRGVAEVTARMEERLCTTRIDDIRRVPKDFKAMRAKLATAGGTSLFSASGPCSEFSGAALASAKAHKSQRRKL